MLKSYSDVTRSGAASAEAQEKGSRQLWILPDSHSHLNSHLILTLILVGLRIHMCFSVRPLKWGIGLLFIGGGNLGEWRYSPSLQGPTDLPRVVGACEQCPVRYWRQWVSRTGEKREEPDVNQHPGRWTGINEGEPGGPSELAACSTASPPGHRARDTWPAPTPSHAR
jgi:hypothetical protein